MTSRREARRERTSRTVPSPSARPGYEVVTSDVLTSTGPLPTEPVATVSHPAEEVLVPTTGPLRVEPEQRPVPIAGFTFVAAALALLLACFVAWALPLALIILVMSIIAIRRPYESRVYAWWAFVMSLLAVAYSTAWLVSALQQIGAS